MLDVSSTVDKRSSLLSEPVALNDVSRDAGIQSKTNENIWLGFNDITLSIIDTKTKEAKYILDNVSGQCISGELYGIIGGSGGGKTTLLSVLGGRLGKLESLDLDCTVAGEVQLRNALANSDSSLSPTQQYVNQHACGTVAFVLQEDLLYATELAREAIEVSALLRLNKSKRMSKQDKLDKAHEILCALDLLKCSETKIGSTAVSGLSGGERKRVSIGIELVTDPNILMLDEPTSGLDSVIAYQTMLLLRKLANCGKMVITSLHQPSSEIFNTLDRVLILVEGKVIYEGKVDALAQYLVAIGYECPRYSNIADFVLQKVSENRAYFISKWDEYSRDNMDSSYTQVKQRMSDVLHLQKAFVPRDDVNKYEMAPICSQLRILTRRQFAIFIRDKIPTFVRFSQAIFTAALEGVLWWQLTEMNEINAADEDYSGEMFRNESDRFGAIFYACTFAAMNAIMTSNMTFPSQRLVFQKERVGGWYYTILWVLAKSLIDLPITFLVMLPFSVIIKYMCDLYADLWGIFLVLSLVALVADSMGFLTGCIAKTPATAAQLIPVTIIPLFLFSNFFVSNSTIPIWIRWIQYIDCFYYGTEALCILEFKNVKSKDGIESGNAFLDSFDMDTDYLMRDICALIVLFVAFRLVAIVSLLKNNGI